jgi:DNA-binding LacI/PurR family transcriptional regulator
MGVLAAETVLQRINAPLKLPYPKEIIVEPDLIVRGSTGPARRGDLEM